MTVAALNEIARLSAAERIQLAEDIWDTIAPEDLPLSEAQRTELDRRLQSHRDNPQSEASWREVRQ